MADRPSEIGPDCSHRVTLFLFSCRRSFRKTDPRSRQSISLAWKNKQTTLFKRLVITKLWENPPYEGAILIFGKETGPGEIIAEGIFQETGRHMSRAVGACCWGMDSSVFIPLLRPYHEPHMPRLTSGDHVTAFLPSRNRTLILARRKCEIQPKLYNGLLCLRRFTPSCKTFLMLQKVTVGLGKKKTFQRSCVYSWT